MNKKTLVILGSGPRGIATAIQALKYKDKFNIYLIDSEPLSTWEYPNMVVDMKMRSPISFDLVTYQKDLQEYSLTNYLKYKFKPSFTQLGIEKNNIFCKRIEFLHYLQNCLQKIEQEGITIIKEQISSITKTQVKLKTRSINYNYLVIAVGRNAEEPVIPNYLRGNKIYFVKDIYTKQWGPNDQLYIVGSGQLASEIAAYIVHTNKTINWAFNHDVKIEQYPVPSYKDWGKFSALSNYYYNSFNKIESKIDYLKRVKEWGPSITPYIFKKLNEKANNINIIQSKNIIVNKDFKYILALGRRPNLNNLPLDFNIASSNLPEQIPLLNSYFGSTTCPNIFFTGRLATHTGGPSQGSIISSGETARIILESIT